MNSRKRIDDPAFIRICSRLDCFNIPNSIDLEYELISRETLPVHILETRGLFPKNIAHAIDILEDNSEKFDGLIVIVRGFGFRDTISKADDVIGMMQVMSYIMSLSGNVIRFYLEVEPEFRNRSN